MSAVPPPIGPVQIRFVLEPTNWALLRIAVLQGGFEQREAPEIARAAGFTGSESTARRHASDLRKLGILDIGAGPYVRYVPNFVGLALYAHLAPLLADPPLLDQGRLSVVALFGENGTDVVASAASPALDLLQTLQARVLEQRVLRRV